MTSVASRNVAALRENRPGAVGSFIGSCTLLSAAAGMVCFGLLAGGAAVCARHILGAPELAFGLRVSALSMAFWLQVGVHNGVWNALRCFESITTVSVARAAVFPVTSLLGAALGRLDGLLVANTIGMIVTVVWGQLVMRRDCRRMGISIRYDAFREHSTVFTRFSLPVLLGTFASAPAVWVCQMLLLRAPDGARELGGLNAALLWRSPILYLTQILSFVNLPLISGAIAAGEHREARHLLRGSAVLSAIYAGSVALALTLFAGPVMSGFGRGFSDAAYLLRIVSWSTVLLVTGAPLGDYLLAHGRTWAIFTLNSLASLIYLAGSWMLLRHGFGASALSYAQLFAYAIQMALMLALVRCSSSDPASG
jgi:O-antigen/teichoic acid export membrane protein